MAPPDGSLSAIILDIDNFKHINDSYGHETGDEAICCCAQGRPGDTVDQILARADAAL